jgi:phosphotriesterase-related protein
MAISALAGKVQTVLGPIDPEDLGITLCHEHLILDTSAWFSMPPTASERGLAYQPVHMENLHWLHYHAANNLDNLRLLDEDLAINEALCFQRAGGSTIVDVTNIGLARDPLGLQRIARATGLRIIMGSGYYVEQGRPPEFASKSEEEIAEEIVRDITIGVGDTGVRSGIIGEIGCCDPLSEGDRKALRASARAQQRTGAPLIIHPGYPHSACSFEIIEVLRSAGADLTRVVLSHICHLPADVQTIAQLAETGCYLEYDIFGRAPGIIIGSGQYRGQDFLEVPSDGQMIATIRQLIDQGYINQILISHDVCHKIRLHHYGGSGYDHILTYVVPLMRAKGMTERYIQTLLVENPKRLLPFI